MAPNPETTELDKRLRKIEDAILDLASAVEQGTWNGVYTQIYHKLLGTTNANEIRFGKEPNAEGGTPPQTTTP